MTDENEIKNNVENQTKPEEVKVESPQETKTEEVKVESPQEIKSETLKAKSQDDSVLTPKLAPSTSAEPFPQETSLNKSNVVELTDESFDTEVLKSGKPILVDFWAEWCGPCKQIGPTLEEISNEMSNEVTIAKHNIDNEPNTPTKYGVRGIPTMLLFKGGELKATKVGATTKSNIVSWIKENI